MVPGMQLMDWLLTPVPAALMQHSRAGVQRASAFLASNARTCAAWRGVVVPPSGIVRVSLSLGTYECGSDVMAPVLVTGATVPALTPGAADTFDADAVLALPDFSSWRNGTSMWLTAEFASATGALHTVCAPQALVLQTEQPAMNRTPEWIGATGPAHAAAVFPLLRTEVREQVVCSWGAATIKEQAAGVTYAVALGSAPGSDDILHWIGVHNSTRLAMSTPEVWAALASRDAAVYCSVRAIGSALLLSNVVSSRPLVLDDSAPDTRAAYVRHGTDPSTSRTSTANMTALQVFVVGFQESVLPQAVTYEAAVGPTVGSTAFAEWRAVGAGPVLTIPNLELTEGMQAYVAVRAVNVLGMRSAVVSTSAPVYIDAQALGITPAYAYLLEDTLTDARNQAALSGSPATLPPLTEWTAGDATPPVATLGVPHAAGVSTPSLGRSCS
ncbi:MAG: hypothetical protein EOO41_04155, partial [Methanobacteriota archaeon]